MIIYLRDLNFNRSYELSLDPNTKCRDLIENESWLRDIGRLIHTFSWNIDHNKLLIDMVRSGANDIMQRLVAEKEIRAGHAECDECSSPTPHTQVILHLRWRSIHNVYYRLDASNRPM